MTRQLPPHPATSHPVAQFLSFIGALIALGVAFFLGLFFVAVVAGLILLGAIALGVRLWLLRRQIQRAVSAQADAGGRVIEGDYTIVDTERSNRAGENAGRRLDR